MTPREEQILTLVSNGKGNKEVAREIGLQEKTIKHHMTSILQKLQVRNRTEAALLLRKLDRNPEIALTRATFVDAEHIRRIYLPVDDRAALRIEDFVAAVPDALPPTSLIDTLLPSGTRGRCMGSIITRSRTRIP